MAEPKYKPTGQDVTEYIETIDHQRKKAEAYELLDIFQEVSGFEPEMWYPNIIGFGQYHYQYESGLEGDASYVAFAPRKAKISLYLSPDFEGREELLTAFGKHTTGKMCIYVNKLADIDKDILREMIKRSIHHTKSVYPQS